MLKKQYIKDENCKHTFLRCMDGKFTCKKCGIRWTNEELIEWERQDWPTILKENYAQEN